MQIKQISVNDLFGIFNHVIPLNTSERITIIHSPNGFGKTAMLRLLNGFFNSQYSVFRIIPFTKFRVEFSDGSSVEIIKKLDISEKQKNKDNIAFDFYKNDSLRESFSLKVSKNQPDPNFPVDIIDEVVPELRRIGLRIWRYLPTGEDLSLHEVLERFEDVLPMRRQGEEPEWLEKLKSSIHIRLIESQRLLNFPSSNRSARTYSTTANSILPTVSAYSKEIAQLIDSKVSEYGTVCISLDRSFPARLVKQFSSHNLTDEQLRHQLSELEDTRSRLIELGLLDQNDNSDFQIQPLDIDPSKKDMLSVYVEDVEKKLSVFSEIASKIDLLRRIINSKFAYSYKEMNFSKEKGFIFKTLYSRSPSNKGTLSPTDLSSGEQHELVLLYELLFKVKPNSLVLIDEPELSLHVSWQSQFLQDLKEITELADLDVLMATHSPDIIQDRWDLTVELKGLQQ